MTARKNLSAGQEMFDGFAVALYDGRFAGGFDLDEESARDISFDDVITFVVTARVGKAQFDETPNGDVKRTNTFKVVNSVSLDPTLAEKLLNSLGVLVNGVNAGQQSLLPNGSNGGSSAPVAAPADVDGEATTVDSGRPVNDPVLARFLADDGA